MVDQDAPDLQFDGSPLVCNVASHRRAAEGMNTMTVPGLERFRRGSRLQSLKWLSTGMRSPQGNRTTQQRS